MEFRPQHCSALGDEEGPGPLKRTKGVGSCLQSEGFLEGLAPRINRMALCPPRLCHTDPTSGSKWWVIVHDLRFHLT